MNKLQKIISTAVLSGVIILNGNSFTNAGIVTDKLPLLTYADHIVYTYDKPNGNKKGSITPTNSLVMIKKIQSDGWAYGSYKISNQNKRVNRWFKMNDLQGYMDFQNYEATAYRDFTAKRARTSELNLGHVAKDDNVLVVAKKGEHFKIIFKDESNAYRMGWIPNYVLEENTNNVSDEVNEYGKESDSYDNYSETSDTSYDEGNNDINTDYNDENSTNESDNFDENENEYENVNNEQNNDSIDDNNEYNDEYSDSNSEDVNGDINDNLNGDINGDGNVDAIDVSLLMNYIKHKTNVIDETKADINGDGKINMTDAQELIKTIKEAGKGTGDANGDGKIDSYDVNMITAHIEGKAVPINRKNADLNGDGNVDESDLEILKEVVRIRG